MSWQRLHLVATLALCQTGAQGGRMPSPDQPCSVRTLFVPIMIHERHASACCTAKPLHHKLLSPPRHEHRLLPNHASPSLPPPLINVSSWNQLQKGMFRSTPVRVLRVPHAFSW